ncbi:MAG TPA: hypothetical protein VGS79_09605 [Puia sp.]|nr:hypothetical protein [Puia sp.]
MNEIDLGAFRALFLEAAVRCFGHAVTVPLTETEAKLFYTKIFDATGLVIGWKSIKNYSGFLLAGSGKPENPSVATLDTLARYVAGAPETTEPERKATAGHYPYWYGYREKWVAGRGTASANTAETGGVNAAETGTGTKLKRFLRGGLKGFLGWLIVGGILVGVLVVLVLVMVYSVKAPGFRDDFHALSADSLAARGWWVVAPDTVYWNKRATDSGGLTLYTLKGDNWPDAEHAPVIRNLLERRIPCSSFTLEWHFEHFIPHQNWQQAGVLLSEGTGFDAPSLRVSIAYNDYNGVYPRSGMILLQAIVSRGRAKPEEIVHLPLLYADSIRRNPALTSDLMHTALRIVKEGSRLRILYSDGILANTSFRQIGSYELPVDFRYAGLFALRGFVDSAENMPVRFSYFSLDCEKH